MVLTCIPAYAAEVVEDIPSIQSFTDDPVAEDDLIMIVTAGINAPSAINQQPWHFSVVTDPAVFDEINGGSSGDSADGESAEGESAEGKSEDAAAPEGESEGGAATTANASVGDSPVAIIISCTGIITLKQRYVPFFVLIRSRSRTYVSGSICSIPLIPDGVNSI